VDVAVIGLGLIGGSVLRALALAGHRLFGYDADPTTRATARTAAARAQAGTRWQVTGAAADAIAQAELVVVAVPLPAVGGVFDELAAIGFTGLVTDVTSVKGAVLDLAMTRLRGGHGRLAGFIGGHPMAGKERSGFEASDPELFTDAPWVLCVEPDTNMADWLELAALITTLGARVVPATADEHDRAVAAVSHLPHLLAAAIAAGVRDDPLALTLGAGSFRDGTRVAASQPSLVAAMCGGNAEAVSDALDTATEALAQARAALVGGDPIADLRPWFATAHAVRAHWPPRPGSSMDLPAHPETLLRLGRVGGWVTAVAKDRGTVSAVRPAT